MATKYKEPVYMQEYEVALINGEKFRLLEPYYSEPDEETIIDWFANASLNSVRCIDNQGIGADIFFQKRSVVRISATQVIKM